MKKNYLNILTGLFLFSILITADSCKKNETNPSTSSYAVSLKTDPTHGQYLVDKNGVTLYIFSNDAKGDNSCAGQCAAYWPTFYAGDLTQDNLGPGLDLADFDTIHVGGEIQTRYKGWPLYHYSPTGDGKPEAAGKITGESVTNWYVAKPDYTIMLANGQLLGSDGKDYLDTYKEGMGKTVYFTDAYGVTLYTFSPDSFDVNTYTKPDFSNNSTWPIYSDSTVVVPSALDKSLFSSINVHGRTQLAYKGWPLYHFGYDDNVRGNTKGVSVPSPGVWPVAEKNMSSAPKK